MKRASANKWINECVSNEWNWWLCEKANTSRILFITLILYRSFSMFTHCGFFSLYFIAVFVIVAYVWICVHISLSLCLCLFQFFTRFYLFYLLVSLFLVSHVVNIPTNKQLKNDKNRLYCIRCIWEARHFLCFFYVSPTYDMEFSPYCGFHRKRK